MLASVLGYEMELETHPMLFSPQAVDRGTLAMLRAVELTPGQRVLDMGCGYGVVGIYAAMRGCEVTMIDIDARAVRCAQYNVQRNGVPARVLTGDGFDALPDTGYDWILLNPPYHSDYSVAKRLLEKGFNRLAVGGQYALVVKRALWYENKMRTLFGGVRKIQDDGYAVLISQRRGLRYASKPGEDTPRG